MANEELLDATKRNDNEAHVTKKTGRFRKGLRRAALIAGGFIVAGVVASILAFIPAIPVAATIAISNISTMATVLGLGGMAGTAAVGLVGGIVHVGRLIFSKSYRERVRNRNNQQVQEHEQDLARDETQELEHIEDHEQEHTQERQQPVKKSTKAAGRYDDLSEENKALYDKIIKKSITSAYGDINDEQLIYIYNLFSNRIERLKDRDKLTPKQETELAQISALAIKAKRHLEKKGINVEEKKSSDTELPFENEEVVRTTVEKIKKKNSSSGR